MKSDGNGLIDGFGQVFGVTIETYIILRRTEIVLCISKVSYLLSLANHVESQEEANGSHGSLGYSLVFVPIQAAAQ